LGKRERVGRKSNRPTEVSTTTTSRKMRSAVKADGRETEIRTRYTGRKKKGGVRKGETKGVFRSRAKKKKSEKGRLQLKMRSIENVAQLGRQKRP